MVTVPSLSYWGGAQPQKTVTTRRLQPSLQPVPVTRHIEIVEASPSLARPQPTVYAVLV